MPPAPALPRPPPPPIRNRHGHANIEDAIRYSYYTPAPGAYDPIHPHVQDYSEPRRLGKISESNHPSAVDHYPRSKAWVPGPGAYCTPDLGHFCLPEGGKLNREPPGERIVLDEYPIPPPGTYGIPDDPGAPRTLNGRFSRDPKVSKFIMDEVNRSKSIPGPGAHDVLETFNAVKPFCPEGGRTLVGSKGVSYFDQAPKSYVGKPGPDAYNLPQAVKANKTRGKIVYRYESATIQETKALINKECVAEVPGPGAYDIKDPAPLSTAPTLKGRSLGHGMPAPFNYNCSADQARNFIVPHSFNSGALLKPVRDTNSGEEIFGTGVRRRSNGSAGSGSRPSRPTSQSRGDLVAPQQLPSAFTCGTDVAQEDQLQWRSGGFAPLKKSKSAVVLRRPEDDPAMEEARKHYPKLARKNNRSAKTFLPMASRRTEVIPTHEGAEEHENLCRGRWQLKALGKSMDMGLANALEPLDMDRLKGYAMEELADKAKYRMELEGLAEEKQSKVLHEMYGVMNEQVVIKAEAEKQKEESRSSLPPEGVGGGDVGEPQEEPPEDGGEPPDDDAVVDSPP